jgi:hypothetical protein
MLLEFISSNNGLMEVRREKQGFEANENKLIELLVPAQPQPKNGISEESEVMIYVNDESGGKRISETLMFKIIVKAT